MPTSQIFEFRASHPAFSMSSFTELNEKLAIETKTFHSIGRNCTGLSKSVGSTHTKPSTFHQRRPACQAKAKLENFILELSRFGLWPAKESRMTSSIDDLVLKLYQVKGILPRRASFNTERELCACRTCNAKLNELVGEVGESVPKVMAGLCLLCVKNGKFTPREENCASAIHRET